MKKDKLSNLLTGVITIVVGMLIAIFGAKTVLNLYLGILACVAGAFLLGSAFILISKKNVVTLTGFFPGCALISIGIGLLIGKINAGVLIDLLVFAVLGGGVGLILYGIYLINKKMTNFGIVNLVAGVAALILAILYLAVPSFESAFWLIVGILIAAYGLYQIFAVAFKK